MDQVPSHLSIKADGEQNGIILLLCKAAGQNLPATCDLLLLGYRWPPLILSSDLYPPLVAGEAAGPADWWHKIQV